MHMLMSALVTWLENVERFEGCEILKKRKKENGKGKKLVLAT